MICSNTLKKYIFITVLFLASGNCGFAASDLENAIKGKSSFWGLTPESTYFWGTFGFGGIAGWSVGYATKKLAKTIAFILGIIIIVIQALAYHHFITIDWEKIQNLVPDQKVRKLWSEFIALVTYNIPFAGAFIAGFFVGFRSG